MKLTIITGGSKGIGQCLIRHLLGQGSVLNISRTPAPVDAPEGSPHKLFNLCVELSDLPALEATLDAWLNEHPEYVVSLFISNAATLELSWLTELSLDRMQKSFAVNTLAPVAISSLLFRLGKFSQDGARIIYVTSSLGRNVEALSFAGIGLYSATKAALGRLASIQRRECALQTPWVSVTQVHPGIVDTAMQHNLRCDKGIDPAFATKTAGLPPYQEGDWDTVAPADKLRTISANFSADFIFWISRIASTDLSHEYDFYSCASFHGETRQWRMHPTG